MNERPPEAPKLNYGLNRTRHSVWPPIAVVILASQIVMCFDYAPILGPREDRYWLASTLILLIGIAIFAFLGDKRGALICLGAILLELLISILLPSFNTAH